MIATLEFAPAQAGVRRARFVPRPHVPVDAACVVANGVREALRTLLGDACRVTMGDPVAIDAPAWRQLTDESLTFATPGRATDVIFAIARTDAHALVRAAFGEDAAPPDAACTDLEAGAIERIVSRCANAVEALCVERRGPTARIDPARLARPAAVFDVRVAAPVPFSLMVGVSRELPEPAPVATLSPGTLVQVRVPVRVVLGRGSLPAPCFLNLRVGSIVSLDTKVAGDGELNLAGQGIAFGTCGVRHGRTAFQVRSTRTRGDAW